MSNNIKVIVNGAKGKMGMETVRTIEKEPDMMLVGQCDVGDDLAAEIKNSGAEVVVDFTHPDVVMANLRTILNSKVHAVVGTTGISKDDLFEIGKLCELNKVNCVVAPNFAIGAVLMMQFAKEAAKHMHHVEIVEMHHSSKVDHPSGTAIKTAIMMKESLGEKAPPIPIHSIRLPGLVAHQEVIFGGIGQTLTIRHDTTSRESFMPGVMMAIRKIKQIKGLVYGLEHIL